jgi:hypothetical protein
MNPPLTTVYHHPHSGPCPFLHPQPAKHNSE